MNPLQLNKQLKQAVLFSDINKVTLLLKMGASASIRVSADDGNLLHHTKDPQIADLLIKNGACVDARNRYRLTPLFLAVKHNNVELTRTFLQYNATTSCTDLKFKYTPLHIAAAAGNLDIVQLLLDFGSSVNAKRNMYFNTPLHCALDAKQVNVHVVRLLLLKGADVTIISAINQLPIIVALKNSCCPPCVIKMLIDFGSPISLCCRGNFTPLHYAVLSACVKKVEILLEYGVSIFQYNIDGENVLHIALSKLGSLEIVKMLLEHSYTIDTNPAMTLKSEIDDEFLRSKEYVNKISPTGMTALHAALLYHDKIKVDLFKELLKHGADISVEYKGKSSYSVALQRAGDLAEILHRYDIICNNYSEAFLKCKRDKESMDEILKLFVKYSILNPEFDKSIFKFVECPSFLSDFLYECNAELLLIEKELNVSNLFEFLNSRESTFRLGCKMLEMCISDTFPIYKDVMKEKLRRSCMLDKLCEMKICVNSENGRKRVYLDWVTTTILVKYLSDNDLFNLIVAFYMVL